MERPYRITRAQWNAMSEAKVLEPDVVYLIGDDTVMCRAAVAGRHHREHQRVRGSCRWPI